MGGGGGVSGGQKNTAAGNLAATGTTAGAQQNQQYNVMRGAQTGTTGFYGDEMKSGLPFYRNLTDYGSGTVAQAFAPQRAALLRQTGTYSNLPSGYRDALMTNLGAQQGRAFDSTLTQSMMANQLAKQQGAAGMQGQEQIAGNQALGYGSLGMGANNSLLYGPSRPTTLGTIGGAVQGVANSFAKGAGQGMAAG
jgi:hypothetical protein